MARRRRPAKALGGESPASRVRIPPSPLASWRGLAARTPVGGAVGVAETTRLHDGSAARASPAGPAVHGATRSLPVDRRAHGRPSPGKSALELVVAQRCERSPGRDPRMPERLGKPHVPDAGDEVLVDERLPDECSSICAPDPARRRRRARSRRPGGPGRVRAWVGRPASAPGRSTASPPTRSRGGRARAGRRGVHACRADRPASDRSSVGGCEGRRLRRSEGAGSCRRRRPPRVADRPRPGRHPSRGPADAGSPPRCDPRRGRGAGPRLDGSSRPPARLSSRGPTPARGAH